MKPCDFSGYTTLYNPRVSGQVAIALVFSTGARTLNITHMLISTKTVYRRRKLLDYEG